MLTIDWAKIDKFYIVLVIVLVFLTMTLIITFRTVFSAFNTAYEIDPATAAAPNTINEDNILESYEWIFGKDVNLE